MSMDNTIRDTRRNLRVHAVLAAVVLVIGLVLMTGKIYADSEPGAIPLLLVVSGIGWYFIARARIRARHK